MSRFTATSFLVLASLGIAVAGATPAADVLVPEFGQIDGKVAMALLPVRLDRAVPRFLPHKGLTAHLVSTSDPSVELVFPSGAWFQPPRGAYRFWLEGEARISPYSLLMAFSPRPFEGSGRISGLPVGDAGRVSLPPGVKRARHLVLRLLHARDVIEGPYPRFELSRRRISTEVMDGVQMPVGKTLAAIWDERERRYSALSRPFEVTKGKTVTAILSAPTPRAAHLVVELQRSKMARDGDDYQRLAVVLTMAGKRKIPDVQVQSADRVYAVWYDLAPGSGRLEAVAPRDAVDLAVRLEPGTIGRTVARMTEPRKLPWEH